MARRAPSLLRGPSPLALPTVGRAGFTLLEVMIALAILSVSLVAVAGINAGAMNMHVYAKRLTVATLLARGKIADVESKLQSEGLPADDESEDGTFDEEGFPSYRWEAQIIRPKTEKLSTDALMAAFGLGGGDGKASPLGDLAGKLPGAGAAAGGAAGGLLGGAMQMQLTAMLDQLGKTLREVRVSVSWPDGKKREQFTVVTHVVSLGPGTDQLQSAAPAAAAALAPPAAPSSPGAAPVVPGGLPARLGPGKMGLPFGPGQYKPGRHR